jgi:hypothetical protein
VDRFRREHEGERNRYPETEKERVDRELLELLQEFRVAVTGVQVLFGFLLTVPFAPGFTRVGQSGRNLFNVALFGAAIASICFIAPVAQHRILFRYGHKAVLIKRANQFGIWGAVALAISMTSATALVMHTLVSSWIAVAVGAVVAILCAWAWFGQALLSRRRESAERRRNGMPR